MTPSRAIVYYTHGVGDPLVFQAVPRQIERAAPFLPVTSCTLSPLDWGRNIVLNEPPGIPTMFKQQLAALHATPEDIIYFCEHDVLYHPTHFDFIPPRSDTYYFNLNVWAVDRADGKALHYDGMKMTSGLCAYKDILIEHYTKKIQWVQDVGKFHQRTMGFEPGKKVSRGRLGDYDWATWRSPLPNIDIKGTWNITRKRFKLEDYRNRRFMKSSWTLTDNVPGWGHTKGCFEEMLKDIASDR